MSGGLESDNRCVLIQFDVSASRHVPVQRLVLNICGIDRVAFKREPSSLLNPSADQYDATLRSLLDKHVRSGRQMLSDLQSVIALVQFGQRGASKGQEESSSEKVESFWSSHS